MIRLVHTNSLSCEPIVRRIPESGRLAVVCGFGGEKEPDIKNYVGICFSSDEGKSWSAVKPISQREHEAVCISDFYVWKNELRVFAHFHNGFFHDWRVKMLVSRDGGETWTEEEPPAGLTKYCCLRGATVLPCGRTVIPYQKYPNRYPFGKDVPIYKSREGSVEQGVAISDDGENFFRRKICDFSLSQRWLWTEATIGRFGEDLIMLIRMDGANELYISRSSDGGESWSTPVPSGIKNPGNKPKLINIDDACLALLNTPVQGARLSDRYPLCVWYSADGLKTFYAKKKVLPVGGIQSYPDGFYENGRLKFTFDYNRKDVFYVDIKAVKR